ncbi:MAG TPA: alpha/beta fold hydrolase [Egibacteraceae bacterium]|nr:alpha/beta fold hydrolase [Egibacteraceae bacterium]
MTVQLHGLERRELDVHGRRLVCHVGGSGPALLLVHGITSSAATWARAARHLTAAHTVIAPDLPGHGESANPPGDYSLGAYAASLRDLLALLDVPRVTLVGHSLGGGIALQTAYLFPELVERLALVSSGGLGSDVHLLLRAATLPGSELVLPLLTAPRVIGAGDAVGRGLNRLGLRMPARVAEIWEGLRHLGAPEARRAFVHTARAVIGPAGQRVSAVDRLYLAELLPTLVVWGAADRIIPAAHGHDAVTRMPGARLEVFERSGHFPHESEPRRFARLVSEFVATTDPAAAESLVATIRRK